MTTLIIEIPDKETEDISNIVRETKMSMLFM